MTKATIELIDQLCDIIDKSKYLILSGTMAVGKTYLANLIAERCREAKYNAQGIYNKSGEYEIETELISIHPSFYYEDFVNGITIDTESGNINFHYADKVFLTMLKKANKSWEKKEDKKYFLILDDISRGAISGILGDMLPLIEPHGLNVYRTVLSSGETISVSPNVYIIATRSTIIDSVEQMNYGFLRHFYEFQLRNDYLYMCDTATDVYSDYDMSANALFYRTKRIVTDHLRHRYQMSLVEKERYIIGHGVYKESGTALIARNQIIPLLRQYVKDNVLAKTANVSIAALQKLVDGQYSKDRTLADVNRIVLQKTGITADSFRAEGLTHQPLVNLVSRIKEQGLVDDSDIANDIMFNPQVVVRKKAKLDKVERDFPTPGYLYIEKTNRDIYTYGTTKNKAGAAKRPRFFYSGNANDFLYGTYHINNDHNVANEFARSYYILEKIGKKSEDFPEDIRAEYKDYWTAFKERYGYSMTEFLYSLFWELRKYYARDYYLTYSSSWEDIGAIYKESAMRLIAPMVIRNQAGTLAEYKEWCESSIDEMWDFKGFLEKPFIKTPAGKTLSLSELTLKNSFFENLFWNIRNCFPRTESRIMSFYGRLFEMYIQDQIEAIANGQKKYLYIREFRYGKGGGNKSSDAYLRIDNKLLAIEAKGFSVLFDCIVNQNVNSNLDKLFIKPVLQADRAFDDNKSIEDFNSVTDLYVLSVTMDSINAVPDYYEHCKNDIEKRKRSTCLKKFYNINIEELEMLLFMVEKQYDIFELLDQYFAEKYMMPLSNYIKSKCPEVIKMTSFLSGVYEEASIKMKEAYGIV